MFEYHTGDLVFQYEKDPTVEYRGIAMQDQVVHCQDLYLSTVKVLWTVQPEFRDLNRIDSKYQIEFVRTGRLGFIRKLTTEELLLHDYYLVRKIGEQQFRNQSSD